MKEMNSDNGILAVVVDDTGKEILHGLVHDEKLDKSTDKQERIALYITSQNSGPDKPIASGGFAIVTSWWTEKGEYIALVHRFRPDEMKPVKAGETPNARVIKPKQPNKPYGKQRE